MSKIIFILAIFSLTALISCFCLLSLWLSPLVHNSLVNVIPQLDSYKDNNALRTMVIGYVSGQGRESISSLSPAEQSHLDDIRLVIQKARLILWLIVLVAAGCLIALWLRRQSTAQFLLAMRQSTRASLLLWLGLTAMAIVFFESIFTSMHYVFFPAGNWLFDPTNDLIINIYPPIFFFYFLSSYAILVLLILLLLQAAFNRLTKKL